jgi:hypothetical protein
LNGQSCAAQALATPPKANEKVNSKVSHSRRINSNLRSLRRRVNANTQD